MTDRDHRIEIGDRVDIQFSSHPCVVGIVTYMPQATGDSWHIMTDGGVVVYVQQFDLMIKIGDA